MLWRPFWLTFIFWVVVGFELYAREAPHPFFVVVLLDNFIANKANNNVFFLNFRSHLSVLNHWLKKHCYLRVPEILAKGVFLSFWVMCQSHPQNMSVFLFTIRPLIIKKIRSHLGVLSSDGKRDETAPEMWNILLRNIEQH